MVVDSHAHVWDPQRLTYGWLRGVLSRPHLPESADRADGKVTDMVFVEAGCVASQADAEVAWVSGLDWPDLRGVVAAVDLRPRSLDRRVTTLAAHPIVVGVRHTLQNELPAVFSSPDFTQSLRKVAAYGLRFDACVSAPQLPALHALLAQIPDLPVVLDHMGKPPVNEGIDSFAGRDWAIGIAALAELSNVSVKISGLAAVASDRTSLIRHGPAFIRHAVDRFGSKRSMLGSDWPVSALCGAATSFSTWIDLVMDAVEVSPSERDDLTSTTARQFYGLTSTHQVV